MTPGQQTALQAYRAADTALAKLREEYRRREVKLLADRAAALRALTPAGERGSLTAASKAIGITDTQVLRLLTEDLTRAIKAALDRVQPTEYTLRPAKGGRSVLLARSIAAIDHESGDRLRRRQDADQIVTQLINAGLEVRGYDDKDPVDELSGYEDIIIRWP